VRWAEPGLATQFADREIEAQRGRTLPKIKEDDWFRGSFSQLFPPFLILQQLRTQPVSLDPGRLEEELPTMNPHTIWPQDWPRHLKTQDGQPPNLTPTPFSSEGVPLESSQMAGLQLVSVLELPPCGPSPKQHHREDKALCQLLCGKVSQDLYHSPRH
jgi:hypothetical protein